MAECVDIKKRGTLTFCVTGLLTVLTKPNRHAGHRSIFMNCWMVFM